jgi:hypothetical protein
MDRVDWLSPLLFTLFGVAFILGCMRACEVDLERCFATRPATQCTPRR